MLAVIVMNAGPVVAQDHQAASSLPFVLPWDDATPSVANVSPWLEKPAGSHGFVRARDGHLYEGDKRIRFFGVSFCFGASFPTHEDAEKIAARMAKFGINCVRFHHMDTQPSPNGILRPDGRTLDPSQLDKLDYFIAQLKKNGIYADLNLHVGRTYPGLPRWEGMPSFDKGVDNFFPSMIGLQREYACDLLTHTNAYTKTRYANEPAIALVEINNENALFDEWWKGVLDAMPPVYADELQRQWNGWLATRYADFPALKRAWQVQEEPLGSELLTNGDFGAGTTGWILEQHENARASASRVEDGLRIDVTTPGTAGWHVQFQQPGLAVRRGRALTASFRAKADSSRRISLGVSQAHNPWRMLAGTEVKLTPQWQRFRLIFAPEETDANARLVFSGLGSQTGSVWLADVSLQPGGVLGLREGETAGDIAWFSKGGFASRTISAQRDWIAFLWDTEERYWIGMARFLKDDLGVKSLVLGTQLGYSPAPIQARLDVVDVHGYWQHPQFPGRPWDPDNWIVRNVSMAAAPDGGILPGMAARRVPGKPYICTEYNHPAPNSYSSEAFLMAAATAAREDWDGLFAFAYSHRRDNWDTRHITSFFDIDQHPTKMVTLPAAVAMFCRGDVSPAPSPLKNWERNEAVEKLRLGGPWALSATPVNWNATNEVFLVNSPRSRAVIGFTRGRTFDLGDVRVTTKSDWSAITLTQMDAAHWLITATGAAENTGMTWKNADRSSVGRNWGTAPSLVEGISAVITLPDPPGRTRVWALDERGQRKRELTVENEEGKSRLELDRGRRRSGTKSKHGKQRAWLIAEKFPPGVTADPA